MEWLVYPVVVLVFVLARSLPRWRVDRGALGLHLNDPWYHLLLAKEIAKHGHRIPKRMSRFLLSTELAYPPLMHWLWSFLPLKGRERLEPAWGGLCDGLAAAALLAVAVRGVPGGTWAGGGLAVLLFLVTPGMLGVGWGPRALHGTPRVFGQLLFTLSAFSFLLFRATGAWGWFWAAAMFGSLIFVSSLFSVQAFVFLNVLLALFSRSWEPLALVAAGFGLSLAWFRGYTLHLRRSHVQMLQAMERSLRQGWFDGESIQRRNRWGELVRFPLTLFRDPQKARMLAYKENTGLIVLTLLPLVPVWFLPGGPAWGAAEGMLQEAGLYVWAGLAVFAATSLRPLLFLGEAERYMEHVVPLVCLGLGAAAVNSPGSAGWIVMGLLLAYSAGASIWNAADFVRRGRQGREAQRRIRETLKWIRRHADGRRFAVLPRNGMNCLIAYRAGGSVLFGRWRGDSPPEVQALRNPASAEFAQHRRALFARYAIDYVVTATRAKGQPGIRGIDFAGGCG
jgi:hypothetical protein